MRVILTAFLIGLATQAQANTCGLQKQIAGKLAEKFKESPVSVGLDGNGNLIETYASDEGT